MGGGEKKTSVFLFMLLVLIIRRDRHTPVYVKCWRLCLLPSQNIVVQRGQDAICCPPQNVAQRGQDAICCPHRMSLREGKMLFVAPTGCRSERPRCFLLPPQDVVIQRIQNAFCLPLARYFLLPPHDAIVINKMLLICCPHRMSFRESKTFRPVATLLV